MMYLLLAYEFFKIGLFSFGGGYATIPFLYDLSVKYGWYTLKELTQMAAVASITPGPVGVNVATYTGIKTIGISGALIATLFEILPSFILVLIVSKLLKKFSDNFYVKSALESLKPISCALLVSVVIGLVIPEITNKESLALLGILLLISFKVKKNPLIYILLGGFAGVIGTLL